MLHPLLIMTIGIVLVIGLIMGLRVNPFIALISAAMVVSLLAFEEDPVTGEHQLAGDAISRVAEAFGGACGSIAIVIGLAAVIGTCMMDSGAADRVVRAFMNVLGEKRSPWALMGSGYVLAVPVFFDTVFYLLVPLARSFFKRTGGAYLKCILAITAGGAITHTLVPPTPGPLTMAANLDIDLGKMILVGALVALPAAVVGITFAGFLDRILNVPMREIAGHEELEPLSDDQLPSLTASLLPVLLPVIMIAIHTVTSTFSNAEILTAAKGLAAEANTTVDAEAQALVDQSKQDSVDIDMMHLVKDEELLEEVQESGGLSRGDALKIIRRQIMKPATREEIGSPGVWTGARRYTKVIGNANLALLISTVIALLVYVKQRGPSKEDMSRLVEKSLMSGGVIILITAGGSSFGAMLKVAQVGDAIRDAFGGADVSGLTMLALGFGIAALLKVAQGSSTAAMIITSSMMPGMLVGLSLPYDRVYLATAIGAGSLVGSWMNDSGFWIFAKMGGLTEKEALSTWTPLLIVLGVVSMAMTLILASVMPLT